MSAKLLSAETVRDQVNLILNRKDLTPLEQRYAELALGHINEVVTEVQTDELYYIQDTRSYTGNSMMWWGPDRRGYVCDVREAGVYSKREAFAQHVARSTDRPWPKAYIDARVAHHVDVQRVNYAECSALTTANTDLGKQSLT